MRFKHFLTEKYLEGSRAPLYHWTADYTLPRILESGKLGYPTKDGYDSMKGITKFSNDYVSFTRDKNYRIRGNRDSNIRLAFDPIKLQQKGYKILPYVDRSVVINARDDEQKALPQRDARFEAEEIIKGPIDLKDGLIAIEADKEVIKKYKHLIERNEKEIEQHLKIAKDIKNGMRFTIDFYKKEKGSNYSDNLHGEWVKKAEQELEKDPDWKPKWFNPERYEKFADGCKDRINEYKKMLSIVKELK
jgi:hypothetical protein